ncbi:unnamed protein product [Ambrosiozyma monospora]|uniref:Unnamed protein product n=1 Tax=Ambrosiozyma monospora TaxID=43982 RepID=A0A9W6YML9_AMBMO|nr:unnamed protein product [Ambrosiozyma monospora]
MSLSQQGFGPDILGYVDRQGRPLVAVVIVLIVGSLCYLAAYSKEGEVFTWMLASYGLSSFLIWGCICVSHLRFRYALKLRGRGPNELPFASQSGIIGSVFGALCSFLILAIEFWVALFPVGENGPNVQSFFKSWMYVPVMVCLCLFYMFWKKDYRILLKSREIDLDTGRGPVDLTLLREEVAEEKAFLAACPWYYRFYKFWC